MLIVGMLVKNEADRWLKESIDSLDCDRLVVLDDCSTDNTVEICKDKGAEVHLSLNSLWEKNEFEQRHRLLELCLEKSNENDFIGIIDADEIIDGISIKKYGVAPHTDHLAFRLFDMWDDEHFRHDALWSGHMRYWPMFTRANKKLLEWKNAGRLHCGRFPTFPGNNIAYTDSTFIKHMGWSTIEDRWTKFKRYMRIDPNGKYGSLEQYISIMDPNPHLVKYGEHNVMSNLQEEI